MRTTRLTIAAALLLIAIPLGQASPARALAPLPVPDSAWFGYNNAGFGDGTIGGVPYRHAMSFNFLTTHVFTATTRAEVSLNAQILRGYNALAAQLGLNDLAGPGLVATVAVDRDGVPYRTFTTRQGTLAAPITIPFDGHRVLHFVVLVSHFSQDAGIVLVAPTAVLLGHANAHGVSLALGATVVQPGAAQAIAVATAPGAPVTLVIAYPGGAERVVGPTPAPASGRYSYALTVPAGVHGTVRVVAVTGGIVAQATFTVG